MTEMQETSEIEQLQPCVLFDEAGSLAPLSAHSIPPTGMARTRRIPQTFMPTISREDLDKALNDLDRMIAAGSPWAED